MARSNKTFKMGLSLEHLERRDVPIIGLATFGNVATLGGMAGIFDGVVHIDGANREGTGSILSTPMYILTAAHVVGDEDAMKALTLPSMEVIFSTQRTGGAVSSIRVDVPSGADYLSVEPTWNHLKDKQIDDADIGIISLPDQDLMTRAPGRVMIAPYQTTPWGGNRYDIYSGPVLGKQFSMVGYGYTGKGPDGQHTERVDRVTIPAPIAGAGNVFTITLPGPRTTAKLNQSSATAAEVAAALNAVDPPGPPGTTKPNSYFVMMVAAGIYDVRYVNDRSNNNDNGGIAAITRFDGAAAAGVAVATANRWAWSDTSGTKRSGENEFDRNKEKNVRILEFDFDDKAASVNPFGTVGLGPTETHFSSGESGGPGIIKNDTGHPQIAGIASFASVHGIGSPDVTPYEDGGGKLYIDMSIGEYGGYTHAQPYMAGYVTPHISKQVDLILDMEFQTYGRSVVGENIEIFVRKVGGKLEIEVKGGDAALDGIYAKLDPATIKTLTIRGTDDNETIHIQGPLGIAGDIFLEGHAGDDIYKISGLNGTLVGGDVKSVYITGGSGANQLEIDESKSSGNARFTIGRGAVGSKWDNQLSREYVNPQNNQIISLTGVHSEGIEIYTLKTGSSDDIVKLDNVFNAFTTFLVDAGSGSNAIDVFHTTNNADGNRYSFVQGPAGSPWDQQLSMATGTGAALVSQPGFFTKGFSNYTLLTGSGKDIIRVEAIAAQLTVHAGNGLDDIYYGAQAGGIDNLNAPVFIDGGGNDANLTYLDDTSSTKRDFQIGPSYQLGWVTALTVLNGNQQAHSRAIKKYNLKTNQLETKVRVALPASTAKEIAFDFGAGDDELTLDGVSPAVLLTANGSGGTDRIVVAGGEITNPTLTSFENLAITGGVLNLNGAAASYAEVAITGGTLDGTANLTATNAFDWTGGTMQGTGRTFALGTLNNVYGFLTLKNRTLELYGTSYLGPNLQGGSGRIINRGTMTFEGRLAGTLENRGSLTAHAGSHITGQLDNRGELKMGEDYNQQSYFVTIDGQLKHTSGIMHIGAPGVKYVQFVVQPSEKYLTQTVVLGGGVMLHPDAKTPLGRTLIRNHGGPAVGAFAGYPEASIVVHNPSGLNALRMSYQQRYGDGYHIALDATPIVIPPTHVNYKNLMAVGKLLSPSVESGVRIEITDQPDHGQLMTSKSGQYAYQPNPQYVGVDTFSYNVFDAVGGLSNGPVTVTLQMDDATSPPGQLSGWDFYNKSMFTVNEDGRINWNTYNLLSNDQYFGTENLVLVGTDHGTYTSPNSKITVDKAGNFEYVPHPNFTGIDIIAWNSIYEHNGNGSTVSLGHPIAIHVLPVNDEPVVSVTTTQATHKGGTFATGNVLYGFNSDIDGDPLSVSLIQGPADGAFELLPNGIYTYDPPPFWNDVETIEYAIIDGNGGAVNATLTLTFTNNAPLVYGRSFNIANNALVIDSVLTNSSDPNGDTLSTYVSTPPLHGTLSLLENGLFIYKPIFGYVGIDQFQYTATDGHGGFNSATVSFDVSEWIGPQLPTGKAGGNNGETQRSRLTTIAVDFDADVDAGTLTGLGAITLTRTAATSIGILGTVVQTGASGANGRILVSQTGPRQITLTFDNANGAVETPGVEHGSLADGRWLLAIPSLGYHSTINGTDLRRLFGDFNADGTINSDDLGAFGNAWGTTAGTTGFIAAFDFNLDGQIDGTDFAAFGTRMGVTL